MLFKTADGNYIEILRSYFTNDTAYYNMILTFKEYSCKKYSAKLITQPDSDSDFEHNKSDKKNHSNLTVNETDRIITIIKRTS
jgi:hypothetical protein